jgi:hypothetical protein
MQIHRYFKGFLIAMFSLSFGAAAALGFLDVEAFANDPPKTFRASPTWTLENEVALAKLAGFKPPSWTRD